MTIELLTKLYPAAAKGTVRFPLSVTYFFNISILQPGTIPMKRWRKLAYGFNWAAECPIEVLQQVLTKAQRELRRRNFLTNKLPATLVELVAIVVA